MKDFLPKLAIISPCYNEEALLEKSVQILLNVLGDLTRRQKIAAESFLYFVDDGTTDATWEILERLHAREPRVKALRLSRNCGHQNALLAGLLSTKDKADGFITIDSDLQDDVSVIEKFLDLHAQGYEIIYGVKENMRRDSLYKKYATLAFTAVTKLMGMRTIDNHADFRFASRQAVAALAEFDEVNVFLRGMFLLLGFKTTTVSYVISERSAGASKYSFKKLVTVAWDGITSFSVTPLRFISALGLFVLACAVLAAFWSLVREQNASINTWLILSALAALSGLQLLALGVIGEYIGKIYAETKHRPRFIKEKELS
jgi:glycosyltransferase involved in cell wall biosynthesis